MNRNSLFFRFTVTLVLSMLLFQAATMALVWGLLLRPLVKASAGDLAELVELSVNTWQDAAADQRAARAASLAQRHRILVGPATPHAPSARAWIPLMRLLSARLSQIYAQDVAIFTDGDGFRFSLTRRGETFDVRLPAARVGTQPFLALGGMFAASLLASAAVAFVLARRLTQPLRDAAKAARQVGRREQPRLSNPRGCDELLELTESFNRMASEVDALVNNRTLLLAGVSHDLRSPLARLRLAIELVRDNRDWQLLDAMQRHVETLSGLLDDYLDFAQGTSGTGATLVALDIEFTELARDFPSRILVSGPPGVFAGVNRIGFLRVLRNLLENAQRYAGDGPIELGWIVRGPRVEICVSDHGPGFTRAPADLLQPFARGEHSRNTRTGGVGLGLAVCNMIAQAQGWDFRLDNRPDGGARACLVVPCAIR